MVDIDPKTLPGSPDSVQATEDGQVYLKHYHDGHVPLMGQYPSGHQYVALTRHHVCMVSIHPEDLGPILAIKQGCCGHPKRNDPAFSYASAEDVKRWKGE